MRRKVCLIKFILPLILFSPFSLYSQIDSVQVNELFAMSFEDLLNQKVSTVSKYDQFFSTAPSSISIISQSEIQKFGYTSLDEILNSQKGFYISNDRNYSYVGDRGFSRPTDYNNRSLLLINGHTYNENVYGSALLDRSLALNPDIIERIEIVRGPGSSIYGSGAMLNVINIITKKGSDIDGIQIKTHAGSYSNKGIDATFGKSYKSGIDFTFSGLAEHTTGPDLYFKELDSPETNNGVSSGLDWEKRFGFYSEISKNNLSVIALVSSREKGIPTGVWETDITNTTKSLDVRSYIELQYQKQLGGNLEMKLRTYYDNYKYSGTYSYDEYKTYDESIGNWGGGEIQFVYSPLKNNTLTGGAEYKYNSKATYREWDSDDFQYSDISTFFSELAFYMQDEYNLGSKLFLTAGVRFDYNSLFKPAVTPRLAAVYKFTDRSSVKLLYSEAHRNPNLYETLYEGEDVHKSNPDIEGERIQTRELVWDHQPLDNLFTSLAVYHYKMKGLIDQDIDDEDGLTYFRNLGEATGKGLEFEVKYRFSTTNLVYFNTTWQKSVNSDTEEELSNSPRFMLKTGLLSTVAGLFILAPEIYYESSRWTVYETKTDPFSLVNMNITSKTFWKHFQVNFKIRNLFDQQYSHPGGFEHVQEAIIQNGRNYQFGINIEL